MLPPVSLRCGFCVLLVERFGKANRVGFADADSANLVLLSDDLKGLSIRNGGMVLYAFV